MDKEELGKILDDLYYGNYSVGITKKDKKLTITKSEDDLITMVNYFLLGKKLLKEINLNKKQIENAQTIACGIDKFT